MKILSFISPESVIAKEHREVNEEHQRLEAFQDQREAWQDTDLPRHFNVDEAMRTLAVIIFRVYDGAETKDQGRSSEGSV